MNEKKQLYEAHALAMAANRNITSLLEEVERQRTELAKSQEMVRLQQSALTTFSGKLAKLEQDLIMLRLKDRGNGPT
jgi:flagellar capping protein FliD